MSCSYADGLSPYENKGKLGLEERFDSKLEIAEKIKTLSEWISSSKHIVVHTGAGISTSAGIPDFRGPKGVWTLEAKGEKPDMNVSFNDAVPTKTHMALVKLIEEGKVHYIVSQNIDGLHLRSGIPRSHLSELHGNMFVEQCNNCSRQFVRNSATTSVGQKSLHKPCPAKRLNGRPCRGQMHDVILDWEHNLPERDLGLADFHSCVADLSICLGTTLQIVPSGNLPLHTKKYGDKGKLVICNLQPTKHDRKADLLIHGYVDEIITQLMQHLGFKIPDYSKNIDPTCKLSLIEWSILPSQVQKMKKLYEEICCKNKVKQSRKKCVKYESIDVNSIVKNNLENETGIMLKRVVEVEGGDIVDVKKVKVEKEFQSDESESINEITVKTEDDSKKSLFTTDSKSFGNEPTYDNSGDSSDFTAEKT